MQTVQFQIEDGKLDTFLTVIDNLKDGLVKSFSIENNQFEQDKEYFQTSLKEIENGTTICIKQEEYNRTMSSFTKDLKSKYADN